ncbi:CgeB family protein [Bacillus tuaregi]|uniref:CgeB family protein n=1 Tax=Bacillus tuaregi TaxID=1816695 RepID=UPI0008F908FF|nr:glycosyltransferase [Bacillus tuaregi]
MKIVLITSGYAGIYPFLEKSIQAALTALDHPFITIAPEYTTQSVEQIENFQPDFILVFVGYKLQQDFLPFFKQKGYRLGIWFTEDPFYLDESIRLAEMFHNIFTIDLGAYEYYTKVLQGKKIYHLPLGTDSAQYFPSQSNHPVLYDLCLIGYPYPERVQLAHLIAEQTPYQLLVAGPLWRRAMQGIAHQRVMVINKWIHPGIVNQLYHQSRMILNPHRSHLFHKNKNSLGIENKSLNNRTFDIAACGGFQLITAKPDTVLHFDSKCELVSYTTVEECLKLIHTFIHDDEKRANYSRRAMERVLSSHTFHHRMQRMIDFLQ